jgi:hypothetical protein
MIRNYIKVGWRNLARSKAGSIINISSPAIGLACIMLFGRYVKDEFGYDRFFNDSQRNLSACLPLFIALTIITFQCVKAALINVVMSLDRNKWNKELDFVENVNERDQPETYQI